jgi:hypothetical protein
MISRSEIINTLLNEKTIPRYKYIAKYALKKISGICPDEKNKKAKINQCSLLELKIIWDNYKDQRNRIDKPKRYLLVGDDIDYNSNKSPSCVPGSYDLNPISEVIKKNNGVLNNSNETLFNAIKTSTIIGGGNSNICQIMIVIIYFIIILIILLLIYILIKECLVPLPKQGAIY